MPPRPAPRPVTEFFINGIVRELPSGSALESVSVTVKDELGQVVARDYLTGSAGQFAWKVPKAGRYFIHKLKIGYKAQVDPDEVDGDRGSPDGDPGFHHGKNRRQDADVLPQGLQHRPVHEASRRGPIRQRRLRTVRGQPLRGPHLQLRSADAVSPAARAQDRRKPQDPGIRPQLHDLHEQGLHDRHDVLGRPEVSPPRPSPRRNTAARFRTEPKQETRRMSSGGFLYRTFFPLHSDTSTLRHLCTSSRPVAGFLFPGLAEAPAATPPPSAGRALPGHTDNRGSSPGWR